MPRGIRNPGTPVAPRKPRSDKGVKRGPNIGTRKGYDPETGEFRILPPTPPVHSVQVVTTRQKEILAQRKWMKDGVNINGDRGPNNERRKHPPQPRFPDHPQWPAFVSWVKTSGVVRRDLLDSLEEDHSGKDWEQVWLTWLAGFMTDRTVLQVR